MHADRFGAQLAAELAGETENRFQGMPSDGDSRAGYEAHGPRGLDRPALARAARRAGVSIRWRRWPPRSASATTGYRSPGYLLSVKTIGNVLLGHASDELRERLLPEIAAGRLVFCQGFSEPEAGSDLAVAAHRPRGATASASSSRATRSGRRAPRSPTGSTSRCAPTLTRRGPTGAYRSWWPTCAPPGSRCARSTPSAAAFCARSSSRTSRCPPASSSASCTAAGAC